MKRLMLVVGLSFAILTACKKPDTGISEPLKESVLDYMPLEIGNYWIYEIYHFDSGEVNSTFVSIDTTFIAKDTLISGIQYFKQEQRMAVFGREIFLRDSGDYIVDNNGRVWFTHVDSINIFNENLVEDYNGDTMYYWYERLISQNSRVTVSAGAFNCLDMLTSAYRQEDSLQIAHPIHRYYSKNVGIIKQTSLFGATLSGYKKELLSYHLESN